MTTQFEDSRLNSLFANTVCSGLSQQHAALLVEVIQTCTHSITNDKQLNLALTLLEQLSDIDCEQNSLLALLLDKLINQIELYQQCHSQNSANEKLALLMKRHNTRQKDLAHIVPQSIISELVNGKRQLTLRHMQAFANYFDVPVQYFI
ncbi:transcriptional regulator [Catenovulum agarivorans DS-2]|uniref:Transcriptional regulator n=1 Tax=Catenovulum agarivorans DS-2 TaxID=1328313 RepID=W7QB99_9ALTE|nr:helix-turn-helix domain-containing protein [Catenovulum agarivorans]EWH09261.1 transcriptional regulator [Catenovulum agarivorans DS-2]